MPECSAILQTALLFLYGKLAPLGHPFGVCKANLRSVEEIMEEEKNSKLQRGLETFGNIFSLNILFLLFCIPVITIGASLTALYVVMLRIVRKEEGPVFKGFWEAFRRNLKKSTILWLLVLLAFCVLGGEIVYVLNFTGTVVNFYMIVIAVEAVLLALILPFLFPLSARYENTILNTIKNALLLSISNLGAWLKIMIAWMAPVLLSYYYPMLFINTWYLWLFLLFGLIAFGTSHTINRVFEKVSAAQKNEDPEN